VFRNTSPGTYTIQVSFIGYEQERDESVQVIAGEQITTHIPLKVIPPDSGQQVHPVEKKEETETYHQETNSKISKYGRADNQRCCPSMT
jgi:hypothetical protein